jgi:hypothetical protein
MSSPHSQPNWNLLRESSMDQDTLVRTSTPRRIDAIISSSVLPPGSTLMFAMRSIGGRFHAHARAFAVPGNPARICDSRPPSGATRMPSRMRNTFCAGVPSSSNA